MSDKPEDVIRSMCLTWRHDFGLEPVDTDTVPNEEFVRFGMTQVEREGLMLQMAQIYQHHFLPAILQARSRAFEEIAAMIDRNGGTMNASDISQAIRQHSKKGKDK